MKEKKGIFIKILRMGLGLAAGIGIGFLMGLFLGSYLDKKESLGQTLMTLGIMLLSFYIGMLFQIVVHESGHLVFGLATGYRFSSFRIGSFMWLREDGRLRLKRQSIAGTGGQCLMSPPELVDGRIPVVLYNLGGSLMNLIVSALLLLLFFVLGEGSLFGMFCAVTAASGVMFALLNGIPMRMGTIDNDGYNALSLGKNKGAMGAFWLQMKVNERLTQGMRLRDMPEEWFKVPSDEAMENSMVSAVGVIVCNRLMDQKRFDEADTLMGHLLEIKSGMVDLHRNLVIGDRIYCELIGQNRREAVDAMYTDSLKKFMKSMKDFPSVLRTQYAYALLAERDPQKAERYLASFEKIAQSYPYASDIASERELMDTAKETFNTIQP